jgi:hypothetical protein
MTTATLATEVRHIPLSKLKPSPANVRLNRRAAGVLLMILAHSSISNPTAPGDPRPVRRAAGAVVGYVLLGPSFIVLAIVASVEAPREQLALELVGRQVGKTAEPPARIAAEDEDEAVGQVWWGRRLRCAQTDRPGG